MVRWLPLTHQVEVSTYSCDVLPPSGGCRSSMNTTVRSRGRVGTKLPRVAGREEKQMGLDSSENSTRRYRKQTTSNVIKTWGGQMFTTLSYLRGAKRCFLTLWASRGKAKEELTCFRITAVTGNDALIHHRHKVVDNMYSYLDLTVFNASHSDRWRVFFTLSIPQFDFLLALSSRSSTYCQ